VQRKTVSPAVSPTNLQILGPLIRERAAKILDGLPIGEEFDWVENVSRELTAMTLATLFGMPQKDRRTLTYWSDVVTAIPGHGVVATREEKVEIFRITAPISSTCGTSASMTSRPETLSRCSRTAPTRAACRWRSSSAT
jgi:cytochrome P450